MFRKSTTRPLRQSLLRMESLEEKTMMTAASLLTYAAPAGQFAPQSAGQASPSANWFTPSQIKQAYNADSLAFQGAGQTIAVILAFDVFDHFTNNDLSKPLPSLQSDINTFDQFYGLPGVTINVVNQIPGVTPPLAPISPGMTYAIWDIEAALDVEWAHAMAPLAKIDLFQAASSSRQDLFSTVDAARNTPGVSVVSMSWEMATTLANGTRGSSEGASDVADNSHFMTPSGHAGITFVASSGDYGYGASYPSSSPNVVGVGATSLTLSGGKYGSETAWNWTADANGQIWATGGGVSDFQAQPSFMKPFMNSIKRTTPDVAFDGDINTPAAVFSSSVGGWTTGAGTSLAAPCWAGLIADANSGRASHGLPTLTNTLADIYAMNANSFHDITSGNNHGAQALHGYDMLTGRGTPFADKVVANLISAEPKLGFVFQNPSIQATVVGANNSATRPVTGASANSIAIPMLAIATTGSSCSSPTNPFVAVDAALADWAGEEPALTFSETPLVRRQAVRR
jgi:subtilase family serine protease